jgi:ABC-type amino acid transport substrate-binding protein
VNYGQKSANGTDPGDEMLALVSSGVADIGIENFVMTKERSEVVAFTDALRIVR